MKRGRRLTKPRRPSRRVAQIYVTSASISQDGQSWQEIYRPDAIICYAWTRPEPESPEDIARRVVREWHEENGLVAWK